MWLAGNPLGRTEKQGWGLALERKRLERAPGSTALSQTLRRVGNAGDQRKNIWRTVTIGYDLDPL